MRGITCVKFCACGGVIATAISNVWQRIRKNWEVAKRQLDMLEAKRRVLLPAQLGHAPALPDTVPPLLAPWPRLDPCPP